MSDITHILEAARRGSGQARLDVDEIEIAAPAAADELLAVHEAPDRLATHDAPKAELVKMRYFAGLSIAETAPVLGILGGRDNGVGVSGIACNSTFFVVARQTSAGFNPAGAITTAAATSCSSKCKPQARSL